MVCQISNRQVGAFMTFHFYKKKSSIRRLITPPPKSMLINFPTLYRPTLLGGIERKTGAKNSLHVWIYSLRYGIELYSRREQIGLFEKPFI